MTLAQLKLEYLNKLQPDNNIIKIEESETVVEWVDGYTGQHYVYLVDLTIHRSDGEVEHVDFAEKAIPLTKYLYAQNQLKNWRLITLEDSPIPW